MIKVTEYLAALFAFAAFLWCGPAIAHFQLNQNVRIVHVVHGENGLDVFVRAPLPYLLADKVGPNEENGLPLPAPFTTNAIVDGVLMHAIDQNALITDPLGLARIMAEEMQIEVGGGRLAPQAIAARVHAIGTEPSFATQTDAASALDAGPVFARSNLVIYAGDTVVDVHLRYVVGRVGAYGLSFTSEPDLPGQDDTANLILDYRGGAIRAYRASGLLNDPMEVSDSASAAAWTFVVEGIRHIVLGIDHVLFVVCMVIGAATLPALFARITGFTIGHTVTLVMGFFGFVPSAPWFIPAVETAIALSIVMAAADAVFQRQNRSCRNRTATCVTACIGLLHGFGFSFMLRNILKVDAENVWQSLLAFNVGVEVGQMMIVALVWPLVLILRSMPDPVWSGAKVAVALSVSLIASIWALERLGGVLA